MKTKETEIFAEQVSMLARLNDDARDGYAAASDHARNAATSKRLLAWSDERGGFAETLRRAGGLPPTDPAQRGTKAGAFHRGWMGLRYFVGGSDEALLEECLRGETTAIATYEYALAHCGPSSEREFRAQIAAQLARIRAHVKELEKDLVTRIQGKDRDSILRRANVLVQSHHTLTLATIGSAGPWASSVSYVHDGFTFYFVSAPTSRHALNIQNDARVAATLNDDFAAWVDVRGLQMEGRAELVSDLSTRADVFAKIFSRFPFLHSIEGDARDVAAASDYALFRFDPAHVWLIDHQHGSHARFEIDLSAASKG
jgi:uncharacterized protein (TIGR02284 family)